MNPKKEAESKPNLEAPNNFEMPTSFFGVNLDDINIDEEFKPPTFPHKEDNQIILSEEIILESIKQYQQLEHSNDYAKEDEFLFNELLCKVWRFALVLEFLIALVYGSSMRTV